MWELWSSDLFDRETPPRLELTSEYRIVALSMLWLQVLREGTQDDGRPTFTSFSLRGPKTISIPRDPSSNPELARLRARLEEADFTMRLAEVHELRLDQPFDFAPFLALPVVLPRRVTEVALALARALGQGEALVSSPPGWRCGARVEIQTSGLFGGTTYESAKTEWTVRAEGLVVSVTDVAEAGWYVEVSGDGPGTAVLRDALLAAGLV